MRTTSSPDTYKNAAQVARQLSVHVNTMTRLLESGEFPGAFRIQRDWRIPESDISDFIDRKRQAAREERKARSAGKHRPSAVS